MRLSFLIKKLAGIAIVCSLYACSGATDTTNVIDTAGVELSNTVVLEPIDQPVVQSGVVTLSWNPPSTNTDGSTITDLTGYKIYYGNDVSSMDNVIDISNPSISTYVIDTLTAGNTYFFSVKSYNSQGIESDFSNTVRT